MLLAPLSQRLYRFRVSFSILLLALSASDQSDAQTADVFDASVAETELVELRRQLDAGDQTPEFLATARTRAGQIAGDASACAARWADERSELETRRDRLTDALSDDVPTTLDQREDVDYQLEIATANQAICADVEEGATAVIDRITEIQSQLAQQFLSFRGDSAIKVIRELPARLRSWPAELRNANELTLIPGLTVVQLFWYLIGGGLLAAGIGVFLRQRFYKWFAAGGGHDAPPQMRFLFPKPLAEYSPSLLSGLAFILVLFLTIEPPSLDLTVMRIALGIFLFGLGCVVIDWSTGPLSPSASVKGLIPDHVRPLRFRLRILLLTLVASFVLLGTNWLTIRMIGPDVTGRAAMIFLVASALLYCILYLGRIPGLQRRFRLVRTAAVVGLLLGMLSILLGYHNFAGYVVHGVTRSALALWILWILVWLVSLAFDYLTDETPAAENLRRALGTTQDSSRSGLGFMQLIADLVLWLSLVVYLIYVWDVAGTTLNSLNDLIVHGTSVGNIRLVPKDIIGGILVFAGLLVVIGWSKRWIDRRWLQHIVMERGAREALVTLFGYAAFVIALLVGLVLAGVELGGLAIVSGALALGIGFGLQEIANNFVSGLILLFERPIRTGDFVTVGDIEGFVRKISIRATEIETLDNQNVLVPNSELVSGRVTNWVLHDTHGRLRVTVGVAYGSNIDLVRELLEQVAREHPEVITDGRAPAPRALFMGFGDSSLDFELRCRINRIERRFTVTSDLNFAIDKEFKDAGISIPFPQRDLHIVSYPDAGGDTPAKPEAAEDTLRTRALAHPETVTRQHRQDSEIAADIAEVWRALTDAETMPRWLNAEVQFAPHIGGAFDITLADGRRQHGRIDVFIPPRRMRLVEGPREGEKPLPTGPITTSILLNEADDKTRISVTVSGFPDSEDWEEDYNRSQSLWQNALVELDDLLTRK